VKLRMVVVVSEGDLFLESNTFLLLFPFSILLIKTSVGVLDARDKAQSRRIGGVSIVITRCMRFTVLREEILGLACHYDDGLCGRLGLTMCDSFHTSCLFFFF
jgi:hypothetical protein